MRVLSLALKQVRVRVRVLSLGLKRVRLNLEYTFSRVQFMAPIQSKFIGNSHRTALHCRGCTALQGLLKELCKHTVHRTWSSPSTQYTVVHCTALQGLLKDMELSKYTVQLPVQCGAVQCSEVFVCHADGNQDREQLICWFVPPMREAPGRLFEYCTEYLFDQN